MQRHHPEVALPTCCRMGTKGISEIITVVKKRRRMITDDEKQCTECKDGDRKQWTSGKLERQHQYLQEGWKGTSERAEQGTRSFALRPRWLEYTLPSKVGNVRSVSKGREKEEGQS